MPAKRLAFIEPGIGLATKRVYEAFGYQVDLCDAGCCGRAKISLGLLDQAIDEVDATIERLTPLINDDSIKAILVAEPSCLSAMKDDWLALKLRAPMELRRKLAAKAFLPEEYLEKQWETHPTRPTFLASKDPVLLHGHCHQKALWGGQTSSAILKRVLGDQLKVLDTGCCGMAGAFGFTCDRYDLSMKIANLTLVPAVNAVPQATVVAPGTSCRHQLHDAAARTALHPMQLLDRLCR
ncbi:MAG: heterodisulfide reductase-related iron-sulfur binding cluster [Planctomycetota bacterium]|nr:heterodisulfide reductase-related iron-sulfur binding cluster [Planctomycetota bacterium]